jgi:hypothetical protein
MDRSAQLGPFGIYDDVKLKQVGLKAGLQKTAEHLQFLIEKTKPGKKRDDLTVEHNRLKSQIAGL